MPETDDGRGPVTDAKLDLFSDEFSAGVPDSNTGIEVAQTDETDDDILESARPVAKIVPSQGTKQVSRTIDLGDGSGKQVFTAATADELLDKLTTAQENATRKIRQQEFELKRTVRARPEREETSTFKQPRDLSADELFALANELQKNPQAAIDKLVEAQTGKSLKQLGETITKYEAAERVNAADTQFLLNHQEDFLPSTNNAKLINKFLVDEKLPHTAKNLEYAFQELTESGLLDVASPDEAQKQNERIAVQPHTRRKPLSTGISNNQSQGTPVLETQNTKGALSEAEVEQLYKLPQEQARVLMNKFIQRARSRQQ